MKTLRYQFDTNGKDQHFPWDTSIHIPKDAMVFGDGLLMEPKTDYIIFPKDYQIYFTSLLPDGVHITMTWHEDEKQRETILRSLLDKLKVH